MTLIKKFERGELDIARLNYPRIILLPKEDGARTLKKFRPISLINYSFKIFANSPNNRLERVCDRLLGPNQTTFVKGRYILESVVAAHELIHHSIREKVKELVLKLDYEKAYDKVDCQFLENLLISRGFGHKWVSWIMKMVKGGSISISLNDDESSYFKPGKGLRQGDHLSPLIFNLVIDVFTRILVKAAKKQHITEFMDSLYPEGIISL
jgi:hypothetical protein